MSLKIAVMGFRHAHINDLVARARERDDMELVGFCEEDAPTRAALEAEGNLGNLHSSYHQMLDTVPCDVVAVGDYYGKRGAILIEAMRRGKHVISDKPLCTSLAELDEIEKLAREKGLAVGCQLDMRDGPNFRTLRRLVQQGELGAVNAISFGGQHPLLYGKRPGWYFEPGKHGGTINDIAIHALDYIPWITELKFSTVNAARNWNAFQPEPRFQDAAQMMLTMDNGCGVLGDVSYFSPDSFGYNLPYYWRVTLWGTGGVAETAYHMKGVALHRAGATAVEQVAPDAGNPGGYLQSFIDTIQGNDAELTTADVLRSARVALQVQHAADEGAANVPIGD